MKGQFCEIDKDKFCQEDGGCKDCLIYQHTCQLCGLFSDEEVRIEEFDGMVFVLCNDTNACLSRQVNKATELIGGLNAESNTR